MRKVKHKCWMDCCEITTNHCIITIIFARNKITQLTDTNIFMEKEKGVKEELGASIKKRSRGSYTNEEKMEAVRLLIDNNYNYYKTCQQTGVGRPALKLWAERYASTFRTDEQVRSVAVQTEINIAKIKGNFIADKYDKISRLADATIHRALELVPEEKDLNKVTGLIRAINDFVRSTTDKDDIESEQKSAQQIMIQKAIMQINQAAQI